MSTLKTIDYEHVAKDIDNLYCFICATVTVKETWESHVKSSSHLKAAKRFDLLFERSNDKVHCKFCSCEVCWKNIKQHGMSHFLIPWDSAEETYNKYEIFFENTILQWNDLFGCCLCDLTFTEWSLALVHVTDSKHQSLKEQKSREFDRTLITLLKDFRFELMVKEGMFAFDKENFECKICKWQNIPASNVLRHIKALIHMCNKSNFVLKEPANISSEEITQLVVPTQAKENNNHIPVLNNRRKVNDTSNVVYNVSPANDVIQDSRELSKEARKHNWENDKKEDHIESKDLISKSGNDCSRQGRVSFNSSLLKNDEIEKNIFSSAALGPVRQLLQSSDDSNFESRDIDDIIEKSSDSVRFHNRRSIGNQLILENSEYSPHKGRRYHELSQKIRGCDNIVILETGNYYCELCCLEMVKPEDVHLHVKTSNHLNSLSNSKSLEIEEPEKKMLENLDPTDFRNDYIAIVNETDVLCVVCDVVLPSASINVHEHNQGKLHSRALKKYGCQHISRIDNDIFYCTSCNCTLPGRQEVHLHVKEEEHKSAFALGPMKKSSVEVEKSFRGQTSSSLRKPNPIGLQQRTAQAPKLLSPPCKPNSIKSKEEITLVENISIPLRKPNSIKSKEEIPSVTQLSISLRKPNSIKPKEEILPLKKLSIPARKPPSIHLNGTITNSKILLSSLRKPHFITRKNEVVQGQELHGFKSKSNPFEEEITGSGKLLFDSHKTYTDNLLFASNSPNNNTTIAEDADTIQESCDYLTVLNETAVFCEICRCTLSHSLQNVDAHVMGKQHRVCLREYGCNNIERQNKLSYFCKCCDVPIAHPKEVYLHLFSPRHLYRVREEKKEKSRIPPKLHIQERIIEDEKKSALVSKICEQTMSLDDMANGNCVDNVIENNLIDLHGNDIVNLDDPDYFCNRCYCRISGLINLLQHVTGKKHKKVIL